MHKGSGDRDFRAGRCMRRWENFCWILFSIAHWRGHCELFHKCELNVLSLSSRLSKENIPICNVFFISQANLKL